MYTVKVSQIFAVIFTQISSLEDNVVKNQNQIKIKLGQGAAGLVASTGRTLNISDAYKVIQAELWLCYCK